MGFPGGMSGKFGFQQFSQSFDLPAVSKHATVLNSSCGQTAAVSGNIHWAIAEQLKEYPGYSALIVSFFNDAGSAQGEVETKVTASTSGAMVEAEYSQGWFLVGTNVQIGVYAITTNPPQNAPTIDLLAWGPGNSDQSGSTTSSISINAGVIGQDPTVNGTFSNSHTTSLSGIMYYDETNGNSVQTSQVMGMYTGGAFEMNGQPVNGQLIQTAGTEPFDVSLQDVMWGAFALEPHAPCINSYKNQEIVTQGIWLFPDTFSGNLGLDLNFRLALGYADATIGVGGATSALQVYNQIIRVPV